MDKSRKEQKPRVFYLGVERVVQNKSLTFFGSVKNLMNVIQSDD